MIRKVNLFIKRLFDIVFSIIGIVILIIIPLYIIIPFIIRISSKGPAVFRQVRVGRDHKSFMMLKFRTMIVEQYDNDGKEIMSEDRITKVGKFLRKTSLDEIMQLFNILSGSMSFVGPRPMLTYQVDRCTQEEKKRFTMRPGVTGLAQVSGRNNIDWAERIKYDIEYVDHFNVFKDFIIIIKTFLLVYKRVGTDVKPEYRKVDRFSRDYKLSNYDNIKINKCNHIESRK